MIVKFLTVLLAKKLSLDKIRNRTEQEISAKEVFSNVTDGAENRIKNIFSMVPI